MRLINKAANPDRVLEKLPIEFSQPFWRDIELRKHLTDFTVSCKELPLQI